MATTTAPRPATSMRPNRKGGNLIPIRVAAMILAAVLSVLYATAQGDRPSASVVETEQVVERGTGSETGRYTSA